MPSRRELENLITIAESIGNSRVASRVAKTVAAAFRKLLKRRAAPKGELIGLALPLDGGPDLIILLAVTDEMLSFAYREADDTWTKVDLEVHVSAAAPSAIKTVGNQSEVSCKLVTTQDGRKKWECTKQ
jgi:hypothetical protein